MPALPLSPEQLKDAARLKAIYTSKKRELGITQESLASSCGWESQGTVSQYLNGKIPLNIEAAVKFARALRVSVADFSPRLAAGLDELREGANPPSASEEVLQHKSNTQIASGAAQSAVLPLAARWPFPLVDEAAFNSLTEEGRLWVQARMVAAIEEAAAKFGTLSEKTDGVMRSLAKVYRFPSTTT